MENDDPAEVRRVLASLPFSDAQRRYIDHILAAWERRAAQPEPVTPP